MSLWELFGTKFPICILIKTTELATRDFLMLYVANAISKKSYLHDFVGSIVVSKVYKIYRECSLS